MIWKLKSIDQREKEDKYGMGKKERLRGSITEKKMQNKVEKYRKVEIRHERISQARENCRARYEDKKRGMGRNRRKTNRSLKFF